jgi:hypothetical protein
LFKFIRQHGWHWICASKANRWLDHYRLAEWWWHLGHQPLERITLRSSKGSRTYTTRSRVGRLRRYPEVVRAVISKRSRRDPRPVYFLSSDTRLSAPGLVKYYTYRWQAEVDNFYVKERLGLADYRLQSVEAIINWHALVLAAYVFLQYRRMLPVLSQPRTKLRSVGEVLRDHQAGHARQTVHHIATLARAGYTPDELVAMFCPT